jgi:hypothetical protein
MPETRAGETVWRAGALQVQGDGTVQWRGTGDRRPRLVFGWADVEGAELVDEEASAGPGPVVALRIDGRSERIASDRADEILALLTVPATGDNGGERKP